MIRALSAFLLMIVLTSASSALAQHPTRIDPARGAVGLVTSVDQNTALLVMNQFARCIAKQRSARSEAVLALPYLSAEQSDAARKLVGGAEDCLGRSGLELRFKPHAMMGGLAEQLILDRLKGSFVARLEQLTEADAEASGLIPRNIAEDFAQCVALRDARTIYDLIATKPTSSQEAALISRLAPHLGLCLVEGQTLALDKPAVRSMLAVGLYRTMSLLSASLK